MIKCKKIIGIILLVIVITIILCKTLFIINQINLLKNNRETLKNKILSLNMNTTVMLKDITCFDWDEVYLFSPYVSKKDVFDVVRDKWFGMRSSVNDIDRIIVFVKDDRVVCYYCSWEDNGGYKFNYSSELFDEKQYIAYNFSDKVEFAVFKNSDYIVLNYVS